MIDSSQDYPAYLDDERKQRLMRLAKGLTNDLMRRTDLGDDARREALVRARRWIEEASNHSVDAKEPQ